MHDYKTAEERRAHVFGSHAADQIDIPDIPPDIAQGEEQRVAYVIGYTTQFAQRWLIHEMCRVAFAGQQQDMLRPEPYPPQDEWHKYSR